MNIRELVRDVYEHVRRITSENSLTDIIVTIGVVPGIYSYVNTCGLDIAVCRIVDANSYNTVTKLAQFAFAKRISQRLTPQLAHRVTSFHGKCFMYTAFFCPLFLHSPLTKTKKNKKRQSSLLVLPKEIVCHASTPICIGYL